MRESVIYQQIYQEGVASGEERWRREEAVGLVIKLLTRKLGNLAPALTSQVRDLPVEEVESLGEALLDFQSIADLESWFGIDR
jgi:predicted transposase YdaD